MQAIGGFPEILRKSSKKAAANKRRNVGHKSLSKRQHLILLIENGLFSLHNYFLTQFLESQITSKPSNAFLPQNSGRKKVASLP